MKSSEEIVNKIINEQNKPKSLRIGRKGEVVRFSRMIESYADRMTTATLDTLKERVEELSDNPSKHMYDSAYLGALGDVIETIEDMQDE